MTAEQSPAPGSLVIGVDVGGTNTDSVLLDLTKPGTSAVISHHKSPSTPDVTDGVKATLESLLSRPLAGSEPGNPQLPDPTSVAALAIGTTHFLNAIVQRDARLLSRVAVVRISSHGFLDSPLPFADWPASIRNLLEGHVGIVPGGVNIDGKQVAPLDPASLKEQAAAIYTSGLRHVVIVGMGSPMDQSFNQEAEAQRHILEEMERLDPRYASSVQFVLSHHVAGPGLLARENASILNAAILDFARRTVQSFTNAMRFVGLQCPLYLTSNAGHLLPYSEAMSFPIRIFSSGATNSMRGAAFLARDEVNNDSGAVVVVDVGGTTSDAGALLPNGYPRLSKTYTDLSGIKINLDMPSVESIGLGGGSKVRSVEASQGSSRITIGPDSVGYALLTEALCFGGKTATATDIAVASSDSVSIGDRSLVNLSPEMLVTAQHRMKNMFESLIDRIKLAPDDCTVVLVGGGAILCPSELRGVKRIIRSEFAGVANAIGAALSKIFGSAEAMIDASDVSGGLDMVRNAAIANAVKKGGKGDRGDITILSETVQWVPYVDGKKEVRVDVACPADHAGVYAAMMQSPAAVDDTLTERVKSQHVEAPGQAHKANEVPPPKYNVEIEEKVDISSYRPNILPSGEWLVSATDLKFLEIGCYILGCGGGGSPYAMYLALLDHLRRGERLSIVSPESLGDDDVLPPIAAIGTPAVGLERIASEAVFHAVEKLAEYQGLKATHVLACEIGGMNGLATLLLGTKRHGCLPAVDGDMMGRAFPQFEMVSQFASEEAESINELLPVAICSGDGRGGIIPAGQKDEAAAGQEIRKICTEFGFAAGAAGNPLSGTKFRRVGIPNTFSLAWRIGRAVRQAQIDSTIGNVVESIVAAAGGPSSAKKIFTGKVHQVDTKITETGHSLGEVVIKKLSDDEMEQTIEGSSEGPEEAWSSVKVPFMNENLAVCATSADGEERILATVPDLISILDVSTGEAIGTQEYRYGIKVVVIVMAPHPVWTTERGLKIAGPAAFELKHEYKSSLKYSKPRGVIEEFKPA
ncbi:hydantoinase/oxoprolinase domain-containing protein [Sarocladium implicatum]|nr:hydantoinase/oxoprolinase domain-containing protein [Sarocladium implicatum]